MTGSAWNASYGVATSHPAWDPGGNGPAFDDAERATVQRVWAGVAEDFAPYDVDVTTEDPGSAGILRSDDADQRYGTQVLISPSDDAWSQDLRSGLRRRRVPRRLRPRQRRRTAPTSPPGSSPRP